MNYIKLHTGEEQTLRQIRRDNPNISIPNGEPDLTHLGYAKIEEFAPPTPGEGEIARQGDPEEYAPGQWRQTWIVEDAPPAPIPQVVSRFQARAALHLAGLLESVETLMQDPSTDLLARLAWQDAQEFKRQSPTVLAMAAALGLTEAQVDELFVTAAGIEA